MLQAVLPDWLFLFDYFLRCSGNGDASVDASADVSILASTLVVVGYLSIDIYFFAFLPFLTPGEEVVEIILK